MLILIEGVDCSGKTTLIQDLLGGISDSSVFKNNIKPEGKTLFSIGRTAGIYLGAYRLAQALKTDVIFDRSHITEIVYSPRRGYQSLEYIDWPAIEEEMKSNACVIYVSAPKEIIERRFKEKGEDYIAEEEIEGLLIGFDEYIKGCKLPLIEISSLNSRYKNLVEVEEFITMLKRTQP